MSQDYLRTTNVTAATIKRLSDQQQLELKPPFQRNPVWLDGQKSYLIDTILHGFPVPELYMQLVTDATGAEMHVVVDGQQRLTALLDFIAGEFSLTGLEADWNDLEFDDLSTDLKTAIYSYVFVVRMLPDMPSDQIRAIFQRLNRNVVALSRQELRHATYWGQFIQSMESLATSSFWRSAGIFTANEVRRMLDVEFVSELAIGVLHGVQNKKTSLERWYAIYEAEYEERERVESIFARTLGEIEMLIPDLNRTRWSKKSDFYSVFIFLATLEPNFPLDRTDRDNLRQQLADFAGDVDLVLRLDPAKSATVVGPVLEYARAVQRAASDLNNRKSRGAALAAYISGERRTVELNPTEPSDEPAQDGDEDSYDEE